MCFFLTFDCVSSLTGM